MRHKLHLLVLFSLLLLSACSESPKEAKKKNSYPRIFPAYVGVTIPYNIAPLNFKLVTPCEAMQVVIKGKEKSITVKGEYKISIPQKKWRQLLANNKGEKLSVELFAKEHGKWRQYRTFSWHVATDKIDSHLCYRLIAPGYESWNKMGIYQRDLTCFTEKALYVNTMNELSCINCHSFCNQDPKTYAFHMRVKNSGTYLVKDGKIEKINTKSKRTFSGGRYLAWHPSGDYMVYSINETLQFFHSTDPNKIEVYDTHSDVAVYDVKQHRYILAPSLNRKGSFETFPAFSADGKTIYFCSADSVKMPEQYLKAKYSLCKVSFDPKTGRVGERVDTLFNARKTNKSITVPRLSPDGKYLLFSMADYGQFHIWHKEADLYMIRLADEKLFKPARVNSNDMESYHSWGSNSRWFVFSSKRVDGLHTVPFFAYMDKDGKTYKPFMLPQKDPDFYDEFLYSYNIPEMVNGEIQETPFDFDQVVKHEQAIPVK